MCKSNQYKKQPPEMFYKEKPFLKILHNSQENTCDRVSFLKRLWHRCFLVNFVKFLRTLFSQNTSERYSTLTHFKSIFHFILTLIIILWWNIEIKWNIDLKKLNWKNDEDCFDQDTAYEITVKMNYLYFN